jgi:hypothetical protein
MTSEDWKNPIACSDYVRYNVIRLMIPYTEFQYTVKYEQTGKIDSPRKNAKNAKKRIGGFEKTSL